MLLEPALHFLQQLESKMSSLKRTAVAVLTLAASVVHAGWHDGRGADHTHGGGRWSERIERPEAAAAPGPGRWAIRPSACVGSQRGAEFEWGRLPCEARPVCRVFAGVDAGPPIVFDPGSFGKHAQEFRHPLPAQKIIASIPRRVASD